MCRNFLASVHSLSSPQVDQRIRIRTLSAIACARPATYVCLVAALRLILQGRLFQSVDQTWREHMQKTVEDPSVLSVARRVGFVDALIDANDKLDTIQKGLNDYLETKRLVRASVQVQKKWPYTEHSCGVSSMPLTALRHR